MAWSAPRTWSIGEIVTAAIMNTHVKDNFRYLKGLDGVVNIENKLAVGASSITPLSPLHAVSSATPASTLYDRGIATYYYPGNSAAAGGYTAYKARGTPSAPTTVQNGDSLALIGLGGYDGTNYLTTAGIYTTANGAVSTGTIPTDMVFTADSTNNTFTERMRITSAGKIGMGQSSPTGPLHIKGSLANWVFFEFDGLAGSAQTVLANSSASYGQTGFSIVRASDGTVQTATLTTASLATATIYTAGAGANVVQLQAASGGYTLARTNGSLTYKVAIWLMTI